mmetsp:Transcript_5862/g.9466  ORF Transcript_5862/g.9466 Transcript_5862/m.9466 type:complete len:102 (+) Transcript_5862:2159-2464(+)
MEGIPTKKKGSRKGRQKSKRAGSRARDDRSGTTSQQVGVNLSTNFKKVPLDPSLFKIQVQRKHMEHLMEDNLDEISKFEVIYKILKDQLRLHQSKLIELKN